VSIRRRFVPAFGKRGPSRPPFASYPQARRFSQTSTALGLVLASTYERWRSTLLVSLEHALYGDFAFSAGLGSLFYTHARWFHLWGH
jgi:hypothetical protein